MEDHFSVGVTPLRGVEIEVERREKILGYVSRGEEFENLGAEPLGGLEKGPQKF